MKGFVVGFPKCGTTTIHEACVKSGLRSAHWRVKGDLGYCGKLIYKRYLAGQDPLADFGDYDVVTQADVCRPSVGMNYWPNLDFAVLKAIRRYHPECCFIMNTRDLDGHIASINGWGGMRQVLIDTDIIGLPAGFGKREEHLRNWIEGHYQACREIFANDKKFVELPITRNDSSREILQKALGVDIGWWGVSPKTTRDQGSKLKASAESIALTTL